MNATQQKARLLDNLIETIVKNGVRDKFEQMMVDKYNAIVPPNTFEQDPFIDDVCSARLVNLIKDKYYQLNGKRRHDLRVSEIPDIRNFKFLRGFGKKTKTELTEVIENYKV